MSELPDLANTRVAVIGLGYVGLPLAVEFSKSFATVGFDIIGGPARVRVEVHSLMLADSVDGRL